MENAKFISPLLSVCGQLTPSELADVKSAGFSTVVINRPDGEANDQPDHDTMSKAATEIGLNIRYLPITPGKITEQDIVTFAKILNDAPPPTLAYCGTGTRAAMLWALAQASSNSIAAILDAADSAGYDLSGLRERLETRRIATMNDRAGESQA